MTRLDKCGCRMKSYRPAFDRRPNRPPLFCCSRRCRCRLQDFRAVRRITTRGRSRFIMLPVRQPIQHRPGRNLISLRRQRRREREATLKGLNDNQLLIPSWRENKRKKRGGRKKKRGEKNRSPSNSRDFDGGGILFKVMRSLISDAHVFTR